MKRYMVGILLVVLTLSSFALLPTSVPRNQTLIVNQLTGRTGVPGNFNIWAGWRSNDRGLQNLLLEPLWCVEYATGEVINALAAESPIYNNDFTKMTVKLRKGVYWSDGKPFTADDLVFTVQLIKKTPGMTYNSEMEIVKEIKKVDAYTVEFTLNKPNSRFHTYFLDRWGALRPLPKHIFEGVKDPLAFEFNPPVGTGPYVVNSFDPGGYWTLWQRRADWQRTPTGMLYGMPQPKYVLVITYGSPEKQVLAMAQHELDAADLTMEALRAALRSVPTARAWRKDYPWTVNIDPCITGITLNNSKEPFNNKEVRWALTLAIDIVEYAANAFDGAVTVSPIHLPLTQAYYNWYFTKLEKWLMDFELDIGGGQKFKPYDPTVPQKLAEYAKKRGYSVPSNPEEIKKVFGPGWWKYAPDVAEKLLTKNGFTKGKDGKWRLPDGKLWKLIIYCTNTDPAHPAYRNAFAAAQAWKNFGIDTEVIVFDTPDVVQRGQYDVSSEWPAAEPWGGHPDLYRVIYPFSKDLYEPVGELAPWGNYSRWWANDKMEKLITDLRTTDWNNETKIINIGVEALKVLVEEMPTIPTFNYPGVIAWDTYYWTNYPGAENMYAQPYHHWPNLKYMLPSLKSTGKK
ncbi:MAG TPA: ABC transporter substrate-binding protein [Fervidobacterium sp.]|nr:ABC transporter substrate-binding protein [Fervidobacterium sp.]